MEESTKLLNVQEVAVLVGRSVQTISGWYRFKKLHPNDRLSKELPNYVRIGKKRTRFWTGEDVPKLIRFAENLPQGRNGKLGEVTQKYVIGSKWNKK